MDFIEKIKVYLDTSVVSHLFQEDVPEKMADTRKLWKMFQDGLYDVVLSTLTLKEISMCAEPKRGHMLDALNQIAFTVVDIDESAWDVAHQIIDMGILTKKSLDDCQHIGAAVVSGCDCILSWNFKHMVNIKTIRGVRAITNLQNRKAIDILNPSVLIDSEE